MQRRLRPRLTYANVAATLALFVALGGGAAAITRVPGRDGVIHGCYGKHGALRVVAHARCPRGQHAVAWSQTGPIGPAGPTGAPGRNGLDGAPATKLWAVVNANGTLAHGSGVVSSFQSFGVDYIVTFDRDVSACAILATANTSSDNHGANARPVGGGKVQVFITNNPDTGTGTGGAPGQTADNFSVAVFC